MTPVIKMRSIGPVSAKWLNKIGIFYKEEVEEMGSVAVYKELKELKGKLTLNMLWALESGIRDVSFFDITDKIKKELKEELNS